MSVVGSGKANRLAAKAAARTLELPWTESEAEEESDVDTFPFLPDAHNCYTQMCSHGFEVVAENRKFVKSTVACTWNLIKTQPCRGTLALHGLEFLDQEHAKAPKAY